MIKNSCYSVQIFESFLKSYFNDYKDRSENVTVNWSFIIIQTRKKTGPCNLSRSGHLGLQAENIFNFGFILSSFSKCLGVACTLVCINALNVADEFFPSYLSLGPPWLTFREIMCRLKWYKFDFVHSIFLKITTK